jgi:hypothetical protein
MRMCVACAGARRQPCAEAGANGAQLALPCACSVGPVGPEHVLVFPGGFVSGFDSLALTSRCSSLRGVDD